MSVLFVFFFKQKTAYEMRISDWSSDVCSAALQHDRSEAARQRLGGDELGLRHRALGSIDQQQYAVDHGENALDLAAEVGMARRVDDVDLGVAPHDCGALGEDGDAALALQIVGVHRALGHLLVGAVGAGLLQQLVDPRRLAVVDEHTYELQSLMRISYAVFCSKNK